MATVILIAGAVAVSIWAQQPDMRLLYGGLDEKEASSIVQHLESESIDYEIRHGGSAIYVPQKAVYKTRMDIVSNGTVSSDMVGFEIFDKNSFGASDFIQRTNLIRAIQGELSRTIAQVKGVRSARVMVVMPENRLLVSQKRSETTASVFVDVGGSRLPESAVLSIQALVANSVEGLVKSGVTVVDNNGNVLSSENREDSIVAGSSAILKYRQSIESYFSNKVESMLEGVLGQGNASVRVHAEIDTEEFTKMEEIYDDESTALTSSITDEEITTSTAPETAGATGSADSGVAQVSGNNTEKESRMREQEFAVDRTVTNTSRRAGTVKRLTASVFVAANTTTVEGAAPQAVPRTQEEMEQLRQIVAKSLGIDLADTLTGEVEVQEMPFANSSLALPNVEAEESAGFDLSQLVQFSSEIIGSVVAFILFIAFLIMYRKLRNQPSPFDQMEQMAASMESGGRSGSEITPDLLNQLISQRPENTAASIKRWLQDKDES